MFTKQIALVSESQYITPQDLSSAAAALQKQATRDFGPVWGVDATVNAFSGLDSIPYGYWPIIISDHIDRPSEGYHWSYTNNIPYARVRYTNAWRFNCGHEMLEMLVDPYGNKMQTADSIWPVQGRASYLVEVCDPCEDASFGYLVDGILLCDFYTPNYFDPVYNAAVRYSFTGAVKKPLQVLKNGYLTWFEHISSKWYQANWFHHDLQILDVTEDMTRNREPLRSRVDKITNNPNKETSFAYVMQQLAEKSNIIEQSVKAYQQNIIMEMSL